MTTEDVKRDGRKPARRSLVEAQEAAMRHGRGGLPQAERAVLVAVEFTGERRKLTAAARLAKTAAAVSAGTALEDVDLSAAPKAVADLDFDASLAEFEELARSAGAEVAATLIQRRPRPDPATLVGQGKLEEIEGVIASTGADLVLFDHDLSPSQLRNLEAKLPCRIIDRTQLILDIFARHARTREGQLQVELAQLEYQLPRLAGRGKSMSQLGGGIGTRGPGETQLETDRRKINLRIDHVKEQLESVRRIRRQQRQRREAVPVPVVALVGYTNAGKSTLFNALTEAGVLESSRMFATLDPKLRQLTLPSRRKILLSDTVGFIRNLPHTLVTSFRATLEEVERAELLLHVRDASSPMVDEQKTQVEKVLAELDVSKKPVIEVLNKIDLVGNDEGMPMGAPGSIAVSGLKKLGLDHLLAAIDGALVVDPLIEMQFRLPQSEGAVLAALEAGAVVAGKRFEGNLAYVTARGPASLLNRFRRFRERVVE
ncbi:GTP-binding protein HflX [Edaphobacter lichenicola]|uniref:GTPase HflX n=2 Tax=Tunturiibacter empetritectus TaxID=3069691 RepID=A0A7W8IJZ1_9BACT|nr:GTP-binding protein HflX [Edaphobacter lichenicola]